MKRCLIALIVALGVTPRPACAGGSAGPAKLIVTILSGAAAAAAAKNADEANSLYHKKESLADKLKAQGIDPENRAIYSAYLQLDKEAIYWERWIGWPNVVLEVEIAGQGSFIFPRIDMGYKGQPILENLIAEYARPGTRIILHVLDDKQFQDAVWKSVLQTKINFSISSEMIADCILRTAVQANGSLVILDKNVEIISPVCMATAEFIVPDSKDGRWLADATFEDSDHKVMGRLQFQQMWSNPVIEAKIAHSTYVFWLVVAGISGLVFAKLLFSKKSPSSS